jgi:hypothetical protein
MGYSFSLVVFEIKKVTNFLLVKDPWFSRPGTDSQIRFPEGNSFAIRESSDRSVVQRKLEPTADTSQCFF